MDELLKIINIFNSNNSINETRKLVSNICEKINYNESKKIIVYIVDYLGINQFGKEWAINLLETFFFNTYFGGENFFLILDRSFENKNTEIIELALMGLKLGFSDDPIYAQKCQKYLNYESFFLYEYSYPICGGANIKKVNFFIFHILMPIFMTVILYNLIQFFEMQNIKFILTHLADKLSAFGDVYV